MPRVSLHICTIRNGLSRILNRHSCYWIALKQIYYRSLITIREIWGRCGSPDKLINYFRLFWPFLSFFSFCFWIMDGLFYNSWLPSISLVTDGWIISYQIILFPFHIAKKNSNSRPPHHYRCLIQCHWYQCHQPFMQFPIQFQTF